MTDFLDFVFSVFVKQGIWILGLSWLLASWSWFFFVRQTGPSGSGFERNSAMKKRALLGAAILAFGIFIAL